MRYKECVQSRNVHQNTKFVRLKMPFLSLKVQETHKEWSSQPDNLNSRIISWSWAFHCCGSLGCRGLTANKWTKLQAVTSQSKGIRKPDQLHLCKSRRGRVGGGKTATESSRRKSAKHEKFLPITSSYYSHNTQAISVHSDVLCKDVLQLLMIETM